MKKQENSSFESGNGVCDEKAKGIMKNKTKLVLMTVGLFISIACFVAAYLNYEAEPSVSALWTMILSTVNFIFVLCVYVGISFKTGVYECEKCGHIFRPGFSEYFLGMHTTAKRRLKCPKCHEKSWCRWKID